MNLFEKLNRLDDSLVESKRVVKKKKLTEDVDNIDDIVATFMNQLKNQVIKEDIPKDKSFIKCGDEVFLVSWNIDLLNITKEEAQDFIEVIWDEDMSVSDLVSYFINENVTLEDYWGEYVDFSIMTSWEYVNGFEDEYDYDYDDDIYEMLTEAELTDMEKLIQTFPDEFGHWSTRPVNKTPKQHKTMNDYARDPNTPTYDNKQVTTDSAMSNRDKLLKAFPDLDIRESRNVLKESMSNAVKKFIQDNVRLIQYEEFEELVYQADIKLTPSQYDEFIQVLEEALGYKVDDKENIRSVKLSQQEKAKKIEQAVGSLSNKLKSVLNKYEGAKILDNWNQIFEEFKYLWFSGRLSDKEMSELIDFFKNSVGVDESKLTLNADITVKFTGGTEGLTWTTFPKMFRNFLPENPAKFLTIAAEGTLNEPGDLYKLIVYLTQEKNYDILNKVHKEFKDEFLKKTGLSKYFN